MKTNFLKTAIATVLFFTGIVSNAQNTDKSKMNADTSECLKLTVSVRDINDKAFEGGTIKLIRDNKEDVVVNRENLSRYQFKLKRNCYYTIEISYPGYVTRRIAVSTTFPKGFSLDAIYKHQTDITMIPEPKGDAQSDFLDFPAGLITYNIVKDSFEVNRKYFSCLRNDFNMAKMQARKEAARN